MKINFLVKRAVEQEDRKTMSREYTEKKGKEYMSGYKRKKKRKKKLKCSGVSKEGQIE